MQIEFYHVAPIPCISISISIYLLKLKIIIIYIDKYSRNKLFLFKNKSYINFLKHLAMNTPTAHTRQLEQLKRICDRAGIKLTQQRLEIFREMVSDRDHPSAERIHKKLQQKMPTIALDTVYRTLATFDELGIVKKLHLMGERALFDANLKQHHHFICTRCKAVQDIYWPEFDASILPEQTSAMGKIQSRHLELRGICQYCMKKEELQNTATSNKPA